MSEYMAFDVLKAVDPLSDKESKRIIYQVKAKKGG
jgi:hypothetical protein